MGSVVENGSMHEFEDGSLFSPESATQKILPSHIAVYESVSGGFQATGSKRWRRDVYRSIKTVVFSNKLNLLMPVGPLAIFIHQLHGHNVSYNCLCDVLYNQSCCFIYFINMLRPITGMGLLFEFIGYNTFG